MKENHLCPQERYHRAKEALLHAQQQKCEAMSEFLAARADLRALLEAVFPGTEPEQHLPTECLPAFGYK